MNNFLKLGSFLFHPLLMPLFGAILYYAISPKYIESELIKAKILAIIIITILIPLITFFLLKNLSVVKDVNLKNVKERRFPLMIQILLLLLIIKMVYSVYETPEMYYYFIGILFSTISALILVLFRLKISLHLMGIAGFTMFMIGISVHYHLNLLFLIGFFIFSIGWVASSRLSVKAHTVPELIIGFFIGVIPQFIMLRLWL